MYFSRIDTTVSHVTKANVSRDSYLSSRVEIVIIFVLTILDAKTLKGSRELRSKVAQTRSLQSLLMIGERICKSVQHSHSLSLRSSHVNVNSQLV